MKKATEWIAIFLTVLGMVIGGYSYVNARIDDVRKESVSKIEIDYIKESLKRIETKVDRNGGRCGR